MDYEYILPYETKEAVSMYIERNTNNTYMIAKQNGGSIDPSHLGTVIKDALGLAISILGKSVQHFEGLAKESDRKTVAVPKCHIQRTQEQQYLDKVHYEDKAKYVGMRVKKARTWVKLFTGRLG